MNNYQWLPSVVEKYTAEYQQKGVALTPKQIARATLEIQSRTHDDIDRLLAMEFDIWLQVPDNASKQDKINAQRIENVVFDHAYLINRPNRHLCSGLTSDASRREDSTPSYEDALAVYFLYSTIKGILQFPKPKAIKLRDGKTYQHLGLGPKLVSEFKRHLEKKGILRPIQC